MHGNGDVVGQRSQGGDKRKPLQVRRESFIRLSTVAYVVDPTLACWGIEGVGGGRVREWHYKNNNN